MSSRFLQAEWRKLAMANYAVDPKVLQKYLPAHTELDTWNNTCYVSLVGFMFLNTKLLGLPIPLHRNFEEVNLRFYVRYLHEKEWRRGVVFIKEIVPKPALTWVANSIYRENYETLPMNHRWIQNNDQLEVSYAWKKHRWHSFSVVTEPSAHVILPGSEAEFITEHYWGYTQRKQGRSSEYGVEHPRWEVYPLKKFTIDVDFAKVYGTDFEFLNKEQPRSVFLAEGSAIQVNKGRMI